MTFQMSSIEVDGAQFPFVFILFFLEMQSCQSHAANITNVYIIMHSVSIMCPVQTIFVQMEFEIRKNIFKMNEIFNFWRACCNLRVFYLHCNVRNRLFCTEIYWNNRAKWPLNQCFYYSLKYWNAKIRIRGVSITIFWKNSCEKTV